MERFLGQNDRIFKVDQNENYRQNEFEDESTLCQSVSLDELEANLVKCKNRSAAGVDGISYFLIKKLPKETKESLCLVYSDAIKRQKL